MKSILSAGVHQFLSQFYACMLELKVDFKWTYERIAEKYGFTSKGWVTKLMALNRIPPETRMQVSRHELSVIDAYNWERAQRASQHMPRPDHFTRRCSGCGRILEAYVFYEKPVYCSDCFDIAEEAIKQLVVRAFFTLSKFVTIS